MSSLLDLPLLVLEEILQYAAYDELAALSRTCRFLDEIISNKVTRVLRLPVEDIDRTVARKDLVKPVLRLEVVTNFSCLDIMLEMTGWRERQRRRRAR